MEFLVDLHVHSDASPDGRDSLPRLVAAAKKRGMDAIFVCDHNLCTEVPAGDFPVLRGCEVSTASGHILGLCLKEPIPASFFAGELPSATAAIDEIHRCGGVAVLAHPFEKPAVREKQYDALLPDAVETANARATLKDRDANRRAARYAAARGLCGVGGSDAHCASEVGNCYTAVTCERLDVDAVRAAIAAGDCRAVLARRAEHVKKGASQMKKAIRGGNIARILVAAAYYIYCLGLDLIGR